MSVSTPTSDEEEVHDLVLMFANSRIPRGSDAFQTIMEDLLPLKEAEEKKNKQGVDEVDSGTIDPIEHRVTPVENLRAKSNTPEQARVRFDSPKSKDNLHNKKGKLQDKNQIRNCSPKPGSHVHWPNAERDIASSPSPQQLHHARLYMKTAPTKPILKHEDDSKDHINVQS